MIGATALSILCALAEATQPKSGLEVGEAVPSFEPIHVAGPDRGTQACPICTYGARPMILVVTRDGPNAALLAANVERLVTARSSDELAQGFVVVTGSTPAKLQRLAREQRISKSALCYPDPEHEQIDLRRKLKINPRAENTVLLYRKFRIAASFVNVDGRRFAAVESAVATLLAPPRRP